MKKSLQLICLGFVALIIGTGLRLMYAFPIDTQPYVEKKYAGWNGVLQAWIYSDWTSGGSFISWLNSCASEFEKMHEGVYLEFTPVSVEALDLLSNDFIRKPDLLFFSPGTLRNPELLVTLQPCEAIRNDLRNYGNARALPIAMGGYIWAYNTSLCETAPMNAGDVIQLTLSSDKSGYSAALMGLLSISTDENVNQSVLPENGIDLGLPAAAPESSFHSEHAMDSFINGELPYIPVSSSDLYRLIRLRDNGKGPDWKLHASGSITCSDQLLLGGIPAQDNKNEQAQLAEEFLQLLLSSDSQSKLADIGAHAVTGEIIYSDFSPYAELDVLLNSRPLWLPACFSEYSTANPEAIVRGFLNKDFSAKEALSMLGFEGT